MQTAIAGCKAIGIKLQPVVVGGLHAIAPLPNWHKEWVVGAPMAHNFFGWGAGVGTTWATCHTSLVANKG